MTDAESIDEVLLETTDKMEKAVAHTQSEFSTVRTGRASPALVERIKVDYYGTEVPLQQLAGFSVPEARLLVVAPYDKNSMKAIEKAIQNSDLGITPSNDGQVIRIPIPPLTEERRREMVKLVKHKVEDGRVALRNVRRDALHDLKEMENEKMISEDEHKRAAEKLDTLVHKLTREAEHIGDAKEAEVLEV